MVKFSMFNFARVFGSEVCIFLMLLTASSTVLAENNCNGQLETLKSRYDVVKSTKDSLGDNGCRIPDPASAVSAGSVLCVDVLLAGAIPDDTGHKTVNNWRKVRGIKIPLPNTNLGYCAGDKANFGALSPDEVNDLKKDFQQIR